MARSRAGAEGGPFLAAALADAEEVEGEALVDEIVESPRLPIAVELEVELPLAPVLLRSEEEEEHARLAPIVHRSEEALVAGPGAHVQADAVVDRQGAGEIGAAHPVEGGGGVAFEGGDHPRGETAVADDPGEAHLEGEQGQISRESLASTRARAISLPPFFRPERPRPPGDGRGSRRFRRGPNASWRRPRRSPSARGPRPWGT